MARLDWRGMVVAATFCELGCGPDAASTTQGDDGDEDTGSSSADDDDDESDIGEEDDTTSSIDTGVVDTTGDTDGPPREELCWSSTLARAEGVEQAWSDGERVLAAAHGSIVTFDGTTWNEIEIDDEVTDVDARTFEDAWLLGRESVLHWDGNVTSLSFTSAGMTPQAIAVAPDGEPWFAAMPYEYCPPIVPCPDPFSEVWTVSGDEWVLVEEPGFVVTELAFVGDVPWLGGNDGEIARRVGEGPWELLETPFSFDVQGIWADGDVVYVQAGDTWRFENDTWTLEIERESFFEGATAIVRGADDELWMLYRRHEAGELDVDGELLRATESGWETVETVRADSELVALADGTLVALGDEHGQLVEAISDPSGAPSVAGRLSRPDLGDTHALSVMGDGTIVGIESHAIQVHGEFGWIPTDTNSIYGSFRAAWGPTANDIFLVNDQEEDAPPLWHFDGDELSPAPFVDAPDGDFRLLDIFGDAPDRIWVAGAFVPDLAFDTTEPVIYRWDGAEWSSVAAPEASNQNFYAREIEVYEDQMWFAGDGVWRQDGDEWTDLTPSGGGMSFQSLGVGVHGAWVIAFVDSGVRLLHLVDDEWIDETDALPGYDSEESYGLVLAQDAQFVWAAWGGEPAGFARFDGTSWEEVPMPEAWTGVNAMVAAPGKLVVHTGARIWSGEECPK
jgi:hypothetical protein